MRQYKEARTFHETPSHPPPVGGRERHAVLSTYRRLVSVTVKKHGATHKTNTYREEKRKGGRAQRKKGSTHKTPGPNTLLKEDTVTAGVMRNDTLV